MHQALKARSSSIDHAQAARIEIFCAEEISAISSRSHTLVCPNMARWLIVWHRWMAGYLGDTVNCMIAAHSGVSVWDDSRKI